MGRKRKWTSVDWEKAPDIQKQVRKIIKTLDLAWGKRGQIFCFRSKNSSSRAYARIWGLTKIWQLALSSEPAYIIEVLSEKFDKLPEREKDKVLIHELAHIPKNFSGSLLPHTRTKGSRNFHDKVETLFKTYLKHANTKNEKRI